MSILVNHVDLRYDYAVLTSWNGGPTYSELDVVIN